EIAPLGRILDAPRAGAARAGARTNEDREPRGYLVGPIGAGNREALGPAKRGEAPLVLTERDSLGHRDQDVRPSGGKLVAPGRQHRKLGVARGHHKANAVLAADTLEGRNEA